MTSRGTSRLIALAVHQFDPLTHYCLRCGCATEQAVDIDRRCSPHNVAPISHILSRRYFDRIVGHELKMLSRS